MSFDTVSYLPMTVSADAEAASSEIARLLDDARSGAPVARAQAPLTDAALWKQWTEGGWQGVGVTLDGEQRTPVRDLIAVAELCGKELVGVPAIGSILARRWLEVGTGAAALPETGRPVSLAMPDADGGMLVPFGADADWVVLLPDGGVKAGSPDSIRNPQDDVYAESLPLRGGSLPDGLALDCYHVGIREAAVLYAASTVGSAERCLERSVEYARDRVAYGKPIGAFQAVRHMLADVYRDVELARSGIVGAMHEPDWVDLLLYCTSCTQRAVATSIQVHGGIGFTWEAGLHFHARHILVVRKLFQALQAAQSRS